MQREEKLMDGSRRSKSKIVDLRGSKFILI